MTSTLLQSDAFGPIHALQVFGNAAAAGVHAVFVHGADRTLQTAAHWTPHLSKVVQHCGCASATAIDLPGHGASPPAPPAPAPPHAAKVAAIDGALRVLQQNASGKLRFLLVGRSLGGRMALEAAAHSAERVAGLVLVAPAVSPEALQQLRRSPGGEAALKLPAVLLWAEDDPIVPFAWAEPLRTAMPVRAHSVVFSFLFVLFLPFIQSFRTRGW